MEDIKRARWPLQKVNAKSTLHEGQADLTEVSGAQEVNTIDCPLGSGLGGWSKGCK